jgi:hypothetical protein
MSGQAHEDRSHIKIPNSQLSNAQLPNCQLPVAPAAAGCKRMLARLVSMCRQQSVTRIERLQCPEVAQAPLPGARLEIGFKSCNASSHRILVQLREARNIRSHARIKVVLRPTPKGSQETVDAVMWDGNRVNAAVPQLVVEGFDEDGTMRVRVAKPHHVDHSGDGVYGFVQVPSL